MSIFGKLRNILPGKGRPEAHGGPMPDRTVFVIGDVHGRADLLDTLLAKIQVWVGQNDTPDHHLVFVGDYIDRGDESAAVLRTVFDLAQARPETVTCLMGNHEKMLLETLDDPADRGPRWLRNGGLQTVASFRIGGLAATSPPERIKESALQLRQALPEGMEDWLRRLPRQWANGDLHVCHAAADPKLAMTEQTEDVLLWGHEEFLRRARQDGQWVVHGHTIVDAPVVSHRRIAIDTGAYYSGALTAALFVPGQPVQFLSTRPGAP